MQPLKKLPQVQWRVAKLRYICYSLCGVMLTVTGLLKASPLNTFVAHQQMVVASPVASHVKTPRHIGSETGIQHPTLSRNLHYRIQPDDFTTNTQSSQLSQPSILQAALVAQQGALATLTFNPKHARMFETIATPFFTAQGWQQAMTPAVRKLHQDWQQHAYFTSVQILQWPSLTASGSQAKPALSADFNVMIVVHQAQKIVSKQPLRLRLRLIPAHQPLGWQIAQWQSQLLARHAFNNQSG